ncbi:hypothetical protein GQ600_27391 [Phytophthora cactorum]|nr:hypothetical protein GQ600_27391 [Phytophthora cactorum]
MSSVEKVYHRLLLPLPYEPERRRLLLSNIFHLANYRVRTTGSPNPHYVRYSYCSECLSFNYGNTMFVSVQFCCVSVTFSGCLLVGSAKTSSFDIR